MANAANIHAVDVIGAQETYETAVAPLRRDWAVAEAYKTFRVAVATDYHTEIAAWDASSRTKGKEKETGRALLEVIRLLVEMDPEERTALVELLKALG